MKENCLNCDLFLSCRNKRKSSTFVCDDYEEFQIKQNRFIEDLFGKEAAKTDTSTFSLTTDYDSKELDLVSMLESVLDSKTSIVPRDLKVNDGDIKEYPNFYEFVTDPKGLGVSPFPRQMFLALWLFADFCVHCSDPDYYEDIFQVPVDMPIAEFPERFQMLEFGVCPCCGKDRRDLFRSKMLHPYRELALVAGQRGGKSMFTSILVCYLLHRYLKLQKPTEVFGLLSNTTLVGTFVALTFQGASELLWAPIRDLIGDSPWYNQLHKLLGDYESRYPGEVFKSMDTFLHYKHRKLLLYPSGPNKRTLRGRTRFATAIDELGWFAAGDAAEGKVLISGDEIYTALDRSLLTVRAAALNLWKQGYVHIPTAYAFNISSPSSIRDNIMVLVKNNLTSRSILTSQLATWELNPNIRRSDLNNEFKNDPVKAERDYGANPPLGDSLYIEDVEGIAACFTGRKNAIEYKYIQKVTERRVLRAAKITKTHQPSLIPPSVLSIDAGVTNNSFSMTLLHRNPNEKGPKVVVPLMVEVIPEKGTMHLNFAKIVSELIHPIIDQFNVQGVVADRWQSILLLHQLAEDFGIYTEQYSVRREDFDLVKSYLLGGEFEMPKLSQKPDSILTPELTNYPNCFDFKPVDHMFLQILTVKDAGRTITKGTGLTDDLFRALVLGSAYVLDDDWADQYLRVASQKSDIGIGAIGSIGGSNTALSTTKIGSVGGMGGSSGGGGANVFARIR